MALITRFSRLMKADIHSMLDRIEEPDSVLRQAVRDMQHEYDRQHGRIDHLKVELTRLAQRSIHIDTALNTIEPQLDDCFTADREDLARELVQRRLELEGAAQRVVAEQQTLSTQVDALQTQQQSNHVHLQSMQQKLDLFVDASSSETTVCSEAVSGVTQTDVEVAFIQEKQKRSST